MDTRILGHIVSAVLAPAASMPAVTICPAKTALLIGRPIDSELQAWVHGSIINILSIGHAATRDAVFCYAFSRLLDAPTCFPCVMCAQAQPTLYRAVDNGSIMARGRL